MIQEKFLTTDQVAQMLQVHPFTILKFIKQGKLKGIKLGRVYRIKESDMQEFIEERLTKESSKKSKKNDPSETKNPPTIESKKSALKNSNLSTSDSVDIEKIAQSKDHQKPSTSNQQVENDHYYII